MRSEAPANFAGVPKKFSSYKTSGIAVLPVPFDRTSTWLKGSSRGPAAIIDASRNLELYDIETGSEVYKRGICTVGAVRAASSAAMVKEVRKRVGRLLHDGKFVVMLGGEHTTALGAIEAHLERFKSMSVLHLDAHADMRESYGGSGLSHACVMRRVRELTEETVSVGVRSMDSSELRAIDGRRTIYADDIRFSAGWIKKAVGLLRENVYITIDVDVFDTGIMPSTGTPEPGGLDWHQVTGLLKETARRKKISGFDVVELRPSGHTRAPDFLVAKLIYKLLSYKFCGK